MSTAEAAPAFSLELDDQHRTLRDWLAGFAADVLRPNGAEWDRRAETPWYIIAEAARLGAYGIEMLNVFLSDQTGLALPITMGDTTITCPSLVRAPMCRRARCGSRSAAIAREPRDRVARP